MDPATFATELEILALRGFGDMGKRARNWMIRDRFIVAQQSCGLRRYLDVVPPDTPIRDIVDRCRVWESHSEQKGSGSGVGLDQDQRGRSGDSREPGSLRSDSLKPMEYPMVDSRVPVRVANVIQSEVVTQRKEGNGCSQIPPLNIISSLEGQPAEVKVPPDEEMRSPSAVLEMGSAERGQSVMEQVRVCFSCGRPGHGVNRCSRVDTSFQFLAPDWSVDVRDGQYQVTRTGELDCGLLREMRDGPGGRVSLPDYRGPRYD